MDFTQFILFAIERNMISNQFGIEVFYATFKDACGEEFDEAKNYGELDNKKFHHALIQLSKIIYAHEETSPFEAMFSNMLVDKMLTSDQRLIKGRLPKSDSATKIAIDQIYSLSAVKLNLNYLDQLKNLYTQYIHFNQN